MIDNITKLWSEECLPYTKDIILEAIANDNRCAAKTILSARQRYFYDKNIHETEAPVILGIMQNALRLQNQRIKEIIVNQSVTVQ